MKPKITLIYDNGYGDVSTVSAEGVMAFNREDIIDWFDNVAMPGIGFSKVEEK